MFVEKKYHSCNLKVKQLKFKPMIFDFISNANAIQKKHKKQYENEINAYFACNLYFSGSSQGEKTKYKYEGYWIII